MPTELRITDFIRLAHTAPSLEFLVIGGYAVAAHGHTRATFDVDFMVRRSQITFWKSRLQEAGLVVYAERAAFVQFTQPGGGDGLDLMLVDDSTFEAMRAGAVFTEFDSVPAYVPAVDNLIALKLHVLRQELPHRTAKDAEDVELLIRRNKLPLESDRYRQLFLRYGTQTLYDTFRRILRHE